MEKLEVVAINSGKGDGHAVLETLRAIDIDEDNTVMMWGDAVLMGPEILTELLATESESSLVFPVRWEELPYVWFAQDELGAVCSANFSKRGEVIPEGYHDQSIFLINTCNVETYLTWMHAVQHRNDAYAGGELNFLHLVHLLYNIGYPAEMYETEFQTFGFNTVLEAEIIEKSLH